MFTKLSPNFWAGRRGHKPRAIVIHITDGSCKSCINWFSKKRSQVSAHYLICKDGRIVKFVEEKNTAWHAGAVDRPRWKKILKGVNPNLYTIGIEHEAKNGEALTQMQLLVSGYLIAGICKRWGIMMNNENIIPHNLICLHKACPGAGVDIDFLISFAKYFKYKV